LVLALMLVPLAVIGWKACSDFLSDSDLLPKNSTS
jgi:hypothetical protein